MSADDENRHVPTEESLTKAPVNSSELAPTQATCAGAVEPAHAVTGPPACAMQSSSPRPLQTQLPPRFLLKHQLWSFGRSHWCSLESWRDSELSRGITVRHQLLTATAAQAHAALWTCSGANGGGGRVASPLVLNVPHEPTDFPQTELMDHSSLVASTLNNGRIRSVSHLAPLGLQ